MKFVQGIPAAEARIQPYPSERTKANLFGLFALATSATALGAAIAAPVENHDQSGKWLLASFILLDVGMVTAIVAGSYRTKSHRTLLESVNLYNQTVDERRCQPATGQAPPTPKP
jgi:hypothetical protein